LSWQQQKTNTPRMYTWPFVNQPTKSFERKKIQMFLDLRWGYVQKNQSEVKTFKWKMHWIQLTEYHSLPTQYTEEYQLFTMFTWLLSCVSLTFPLALQVPYHILLEKILKFKIWNKGLGEWLKWLKA
jgi:hypothetical protein